MTLALACLASSMNGSVQKRVREAREAHQEEIATLQQAHEEEVRKIKDTMTIEKEAIQRQIKQQIENQHAPALQEMAEKIQQTRDARIQEFIRELQNELLEVEVRTNAQISEQQANRHQVSHHRQTVVSCPAAYSLMSQEMEEELEQLRANTRRWNDKAADVVCIRDVRPPRRRCAGILLVGRVIGGLLILLVPAASLSGYTCST